MGGKRLGSGGNGFSFTENEVGSNERRLGLNDNGLGLNEKGLGSDEKGLGVILNGLGVFEDVDGNTESAFKDRQDEVGTSYKLQHNRGIFYN